MNMTTTNIAKRVYDHTFKLDPIVRSLLDTDIYKLLMLQMIWKKYADIPVTLSLINRNPSIKLAEEINIDELRQQLDHARTIRVSKKERIWLMGNTFYGKERLFQSDFINWLKDYQLPEYQLSKNKEQFEIHFTGSWADVTLWEIPVLSIISELRSRAALKNTNQFDLDITYARAKTKLWEKLIRLNKLDNLEIADFGTRRRHSFLWQNWCVDALKQGLGEKFTGTSNVLLAMNHDLEAIGTNAHELQMVIATLSKTNDELRLSPYNTLQNWQQTYDGNLLIALPDTFGTTSFLQHAPSWISEWSGFRIDSKEPIEGGEQLIDWWKNMKQDPKQKRLIFSDGLNIEEIERVYHHFQGRVRLSFGWGTNLTNDFHHCSPVDNKQLDAFSLVCKITQANGKATVKLSDNPEKSTGTQAEIDHYIKVFGTQDFHSTTPLV